MEDSNYKKGIMNIGNNCYFNSGLQIISSCDILFKELESYNYYKTSLTSLLKEAKKKIINFIEYNPEHFIIAFSRVNNQPGFLQNCSQDFIRKLIKNINQEIINYGGPQIIFEYFTDNKKEMISYQKFINSNNYFPESKVLSLFSGISKSFIFGKCKYCHNFIEDYSFSYFIDQIIYLDFELRNYYFSEILDLNLGKNNISVDCPICLKNIEISEITKLIKLPDVLIFTFERYINGKNNISIEPNLKINYEKYVDESLKKKYHYTYNYDLFAINIRIGESKDYGHEICQIKRNGEWYEINDNRIYKINKFNYKDSIYGLFYKRV